MKSVSPFQSLICLLLLMPAFGEAQNNTVVLSSNMFETPQTLRLAKLDGWLFKQGHDPSWSGLDLDNKGWRKLKPTELSAEMADGDGRIEGWFRLRIRLDSSFDTIPLGFSRQLWAATDIYVDGELISAFGNTGATGEPFKEFNPLGKLPASVQLKSGKEYLLAMHFVNYEHEFMLRELRLKPNNLQNLLNLTGSEYRSFIERITKETYAYATATITIAGLLLVFFWILAIQNPKEYTFRLIAILSSLIFLQSIFNYFNFLFEASYTTKIVVGIIWTLIAPFIVSLDLIIAEWIMAKKIPYLSMGILLVFPIVSAIAHLYDESLPFSIVNALFLIYFSYLVFSSRKTLTGGQGAVVIGMIVNVTGLMVWIGLHKYYYNFFIVYDNLIIVTSMLAIPLSLLVYVALRLNQILKEIKDNANKLVQMSEEKKVMLANQNIILEQQVNERTRELNQSIQNLKATQSQLIQSEKMASLGELTAGIAHEIQNPLNFVNNFSEVSNELLDEMKSELASGNLQPATQLADDVKQNLEKILHHGKRADAIVKGMLQHSRSSSGVKEPTDINALADEYLRLAYHGLRAKDKTFNATLKTDFDPSVGNINIIPQDIGRVILNLITNAFYAVANASTRGASDKQYEPTVTVSTRRSRSSGEGRGEVEIRVSDNGNGIPSPIKDKIFQPFFTTKPTGQGTGLGLSLSYDIVKAHGGELRVETKEGQGSEFIIQLPN